MTLAVDMPEVGGLPHAAAFETHRRYLWGLCYRMTGCAADADDVIQETFVRALQHPPEGDGASWRPWLVRVAMNLSHDLLRRRRRQKYVGPWLPSPIETDDGSSPPGIEAELDHGVTTEGRYDLLESVSLAFLCALEALTPRQRAVLLLMDVFDYTVKETAEALAISESNTKVTHLRARRAMRDYEARRRPLKVMQEEARTALMQFMTALGEQDLAAIEKLLAGDVVLLNDGAGEFHAARKPIFGPIRVARFNFKIITRRTATSKSRACMLNGLPAFLVEFHDRRPGEPPRATFSVTTDADGKVSGIFSVVATRKLHGLRFPSDETDA